MINWTIYRAVLQLTSPLHIGFQQVGNLLRTRPYVPGRVIWGALTAQLTRQDEAQNYGAILDLVNASVRCSYFYPTFDPDTPAETILYPYFDCQQERFVFGSQEKWSVEKFEGCFLASQAATAINAAQASAEDGSLHEVEYLQHLVKQAEAVKSVYLVGYLWLDSADEKLPDRIEYVLDRLQLGGERSYGFGRIKKNSFAKQLDQNVFGVYPHDKFILNEANPRLALDGEIVLLAHVQTHTDLDRCVRGNIEPVVGREWNRSAGKYGLTEATVCWTPGSVLSAPSAVFEIAAQGLWQIHQTP